LTGWSRWVVASTAGFQTPQNLNKAISILSQKAWTAVNFQPGPSQPEALQPATQANLRPRRKVARARPI
jgi:hypothetical protein